jgi:hypothetical protein
MATWVLPAPAQPGDGLDESDVGARGERSLQVGEERLMLAVTAAPHGLAATLPGETYRVPRASHGSVATTARPGRVRGQNPRSDPHQILVRDVMSSDSYVCDLVSHTRFTSGSTRLLT